MTRAKHTIRYRLCLIAALALISCSKPPTGPPPSAYPIAVDLAKVGEYPALTKSGGGYFYDDVLEYRVWVHPGGDDYYCAFATYEEAKRFSEGTARAEEPLVLVRQLEHVNEPKPSVFEHVKRERITEWRVEWLQGTKRGPDSIRNLLEEKRKEAQQSAPGA